MFRLLIAGLIATMLSGCAGTKPLEVASITSINGGSGTVGSDVYAGRRKQGEQVPQLAGDQILPIRTYKAKAGTFGGEVKGKEMAGASCHVTARYFSADVVTPAKVRVPIYRNQSSPITVSCSKKGYGTRSVVVEVYNKTKSDRHNSASSAGASAGLIGVLVSSVAVAAINAASDENTHVFKYQTVQIVLAPLDLKKSKKKIKKS